MSQTQAPTQAANGGSTESWGTRIGVILAVTGSAVGLGNFLRFPGLAAQYGGGVFMVPYIISFLLLGLPIAWAEWALGRAGGAKGYNSAPGVLRGVWGGSAGSYFGFFGPLIPLLVYMYYVFVEAWCLCYALMYSMAWFNAGPFAAPVEGAETLNIESFFNSFTGITGNGTASVWLILALVACFVLNFGLIYRGLSRGIEVFCRYAMPALVIIALVILVRVLTLGGGSDAPGDNKYDLLDGLGAMWNPTPQIDNLAAIDPKRKIFADTGLASLMGARSGVAGNKVHSERVGDSENSFKATVSSAPSGSDEIPLYTLDISNGVLQKVTFQDPVASEAALVARGYEKDGATFVHTGSRLRLSLAGSELTPIAPGFLESLADPEIWLAAAGQIFFSLSIGFGIILVYASYLRPTDDVALSSLTAAAGNGFCEVALGGLITIPAAFMFLGPAFVANPPGTFGMGFVALPGVFETMPGGPLWGFLFFFLLFLAAVTSSLSMVQPATAFVEEGFGWTRGKAVALVALVSALGTGFVVYFSGGAAAIDAIDFWVGQVLIFIFATIIVLIFGWKLGKQDGWEELTRGSDIKLPTFVRFLIRYVAPIYLVSVFILWAFYKLPDRVHNLWVGGLTGEVWSLLLIVVVAAGVIAVLILADQRWRRFGPDAPPIGSFPIEPKPFERKDD